VDNLHVNSHLAAVVGDDKDTDGAAARLESLLEAGPEVALINDREVLLDIAGLGHGNDGTILHVKDAVLLEDRAEHGLDDDAGGGVGDEGRLLMELLGEEINTKVAVLASGSRGRDADDLAGAALEDEDVAKTDVMAGDGDGVGSGLGLDTGGAGNLSAGGVSVLVVVTHFGFGSFGAGRNGGRSVGAGLNGLFDDLYVLADDGARSARGSDGEVVGVRGCLLDGSRLYGEADGEIADVGVSLLNGSRAVA